MARNDSENLDAIVRDAMSDGPLRPVPFGLHRRIENRVEICALVQAERRWFSHSILPRLLVFLTVSFAAVLLTVMLGLTDFPSPVLPGGWGLLDYMLTTFHMEWLTMLESVVAILSGLTVFALLMTLIPMGSRLIRRG